MEKLKAAAEEKFKSDIETKYFYRPAPEFESVDEAKVNVATVLKEEMIIKKKKKEEEDYIKQVEMNMRDSAEFKNWKKEQEEKEMIEKLEHQEKSKR